VRYPCFHPILIRHLPYSRTAIRFSLNRRACRASIHAIAARRFLRDAVVVHQSSSLSPDLCLLVFCPPPSDPERIVDETPSLPDGSRLFRPFGADARQPCRRGGVCRGLRAGEGPRGGPEAVDPRHGGLLLLPLPPLPEHAAI